MNNTFGTPGQSIDNALEGRDDPNRGPLDRLENALTGRTDPEYGQAGTTIGGGVISAVFDSHDEARDAVAALRAAGVSDASLSLIAQSGRTTTTTDVHGDVTDEEHTSIVRGILGGGALGAGLAVAALAIPGVGPLVAAGAIAGSAVPGAMAVGAAVGAAAGTLNESLKAHGVSDEDAAYYDAPMRSGGVLVTVTPDGAVDTETVRDILHSHGGHNAGRARTV